MSGQARPTPGGEVEPVWSTYMHQKGARLGLPISGTFELTARCNFKCKMCYICQSEAEIRASGRRELTMEEWLAIAESAKQAGMIFLLLTGGEPLIYPQLPRLLSELKRMGLLVSMNTNGFLLSGRLLEALLRDPPLRLNVTLYGGSNATYARMCGRPAFDQVRENLRVAKRAGLSIRLSASITPDNADDVAEIYRLAEELDLHVKASSYMFPPARLGEEHADRAAHRFSPEEAARYQILCREQTMTEEELRLAVATGDFPLDEECAGGEGEAVLCRAGRSTFWVTWDGHMTPCGMMNSQGLPILEAGFSKAWQAVRDEIDAIRLPDACGGCAMRAQCTLCAAACHAETGGYSERPQYLCDMTHALVRQMRAKYGSET